MSIDLQSAKTLCTAAELKLCENAQADQIVKLTTSELSDAVKRSRTLRDKWRDVARSQRRSTQSAQAARQTAANARSEEKAALFDAVHQMFVDRQKFLRENDDSQAKAGPGPISVPKKDRKIVTRAVRSIVKGELKQAKTTINRNMKASSVKEPMTGASRQVTAARSRTAEPVVTAKSSAQTKKASTSRTSKKAGKPKTPVVSKTRKKALAKRAGLAESKPRTAPTSKPQTGASILSKSVPGKAALASSNRALSAKATKARVAKGGGKRVQGHVSAAGKRSQARRDGKR